jgi:hypothetical protein
MHILRHLRSSRGSLAPFYVRARRRRVVRALRCPVLIATLLILVALVVLATSRLPC